MFQIIFLTFVFKSKRDIFVLTLHKMNDPYTHNYLGHLKNKEAHQFFKSYRQVSYKNYLKLKLLSNHQFNPIERSCIDPNSEFIESVFMNLTTELRNLQEEYLTTNKNIDFRGPYKSLQDNTQCNFEERNSTTTNQLSLCPWSYAVIYRYDRYPQLRTIAKCTCDSCTTIDGLLSKLYNCIPVYDTVPYLKKSWCGADGYYNWIPMMEQISVACACAHSYKYVPL